MTSVTPEQIDALLPQTQCGLCGYGGCLPYAEALLYENAAINLCPPGGVKTLCAVSELLGKDPTPHLEEMEQKTEPKMLAIIREAECIGCTKCIQACPVDAILGAAKQMHSVITDECTGCKLCVAPCPVDCIDMLVVNPKNEEEEMAARNIARQRFQAKNKRLAKENEILNVVKKASSLNSKRKYVQAAIERAKLKKKAQLT